MWSSSLCVVQFWLTLAAGFNFQSNTPPRIGISGWITTENARAGNEWEHGGLSKLLVSGSVNVERSSNGTTIVISPHLNKMRIVCNATYPVRWYATTSDYRPDDIHNPIYYIYETRYVKNVRDPQTFTYQSTLEIEDSTDGISRNFYCQSLSNQKLVRNLYMYWEGAAQLAYAGELIDVRTIDNETIVLPCTVTRPDAFVVLLKDSPVGEMVFSRNGSIRYAPDVGFTLLLNKLEDPYGRYRCISDDEEETRVTDERSVRINVLHGYHEDYHPKNLIFNETLQFNATFRFDEVSAKFVCCSSTWRPPNLKVIYCDDRLSCKLKEEFLSQISSGHPRWSANGSCATYDVFRKNSGILRCRGDGIDIFKTYYTGMTNPFAENDTVKVYYSLSGVLEDDLVTVIPLELLHSLYHQQNFSAFCDTSEFYFSKGIQWGIRWQNNSIQFLNEENNPYAEQKFMYSRGTDFNTVVVTAENGMEEIVCYAPVWNSTDWVKKSLPLNIKEAIVPGVFMDEPESVYWFVNETGKKIICDASGDPLPFVHWRKDNKTLYPDSSFDMEEDFDNGTSILKINRVSHDTQGEYICTGINLAGEDQRFVKVFVLEPPTTTSAGLVIFIVTAACFSLLIVLFLLVWKLKLQKNIIDHLTRVVFRDNQS